MKKEPSVEWLMFVRLATALKQHKTYCEPILKGILADISKEHNRVVLSIDFEQYSTPVITKGEYPICSCTYSDSRTENEIARQAVRTKCLHLFRKKFLHSWRNAALVNSYTCPICRYLLFDVVDALPENLRTVAR